MSTLKVNAIRGTGASSDAISVNSTDGTCTAKITNLPTGSRNKLINGAMTVAQKYGSTLQTGQDGSGGLYVDRWLWSMSSAGTWTLGQVTESPNGFANSLKADCTTADGSLGTGDYIFLRQKIEGQNLQDFAKGTADAKQFAVSFYIKTSKTGVYTVELQDNDNSRIASKTITVSDTNWNRYTLIFPADTTGALDNDAARSFTINFWLAAGTDFTSGTLNTSSWAAISNVNRVSSSNVNLADSTSNTWHITGIQLEVGDVATDFEHRSYGDELARCQRYFYRTIARGMAPARGAGSSALLAGWVTPVPLRASPTISKGDDTDNGNWNIRAYETDGVSDSANTPTVGTRGFVVNQNQVTIYQTGHSVTDDRVLTIYQGGGYMDFSSEL